MQRRIMLAAPALLFSQEKPQVETTLVRDFVGISHRRDVAPVRERLTRTPGLLNASWDWGNGDWESAVQAAAHTGGRDIANFLLDAGARLDLPTASMLGLVDVLKAASSTPGFLKATGAHGIPLLSHAVAGRSMAAAQFLLDAGVDVTAKHHNGMTAMSIAEQTKQPEMIELLATRLKSAGSSSAGTPRTAP